MKTLPGEKCCGCMKRVCRVRFDTSVCVKGRAAQLITVLVCCGMTCPCPSNTQPGNFGSSSCIGSEEHQPGCQPVTSCWQHSLACTAALQLVVAGSKVTLCR